MLSDRIAPACIFPFFGKEVRPGEPVFLDIAPQFLDIVIQADADDLEAPVVQRGA